MQGAREAKQSWGFDAEEGDAVLTRILLPIPCVCLINPGHSL